MARKRKPLPEYERPIMPFEREADLSRGVGAWASVGFEFGIYVAVFFLGGLWLDGKFGTKPWLAALGAMFGVGIGMYMLIRRVMHDPGLKDPGLNDATLDGQEKKDGDGPTTM
jgi:F0F1-type ATP synthase assembly protein I